MSRIFLQRFSSLSPAKRQIGIFKQVLEVVKQENKRDLRLLKKIEKTERCAQYIGEKKRLILRKTKHSICASSKFLTRKVGQINKSVDSSIYSAWKAMSKWLIPLELAMETIGRYTYHPYHMIFENVIFKGMGRIRNIFMNENGCDLYGGFPSKGEREVTRKHRIEMMKNRHTTGSKEHRLVLYNRSLLGERWKDFRDKNPIFKSLFDIKKAYDESYNIFVFFARQISDSFIECLRYIFNENETARVVREITRIDPEFHMEGFLEDLRMFIIPELLDSFLSLDFASLELWCSGYIVEVLKRSIEHYTTKEEHICGKVLDLRNLDFLTAKIVDGDIPVIVVSFSTQQINYVQNIKTGSVVSGSKERTVNVDYVWAFAKEPEHNAVTGGWKLIEMAARS